MAAKKQTTKINTISDRFIVSVQKQCWFGIGMAHVFDKEAKNEGRAIESIPVNTKEELKALCAKYFNCKWEYQS
jgi:hypothetical protein